LKLVSSVDWSTQLRVILVLVAAVEPSPLGAAGAVGKVVALAVFEYAESPSLFDARTRYE
jgi:hypothetical protein